MPDTTQSHQDSFTNRELWLTSLTLLGKKLIAPPAGSREKAPAGEQR